jgi:hypothetical protein
MFSKINLFGGRCRSRLNYARAYAGHSRPVRGLAWLLIIGLETSHMLIDVSPV